MEDVVRIEILKARLGALVLAGACAHDVRLAQILLEAASVRVLPTSIKRLVYGISGQSP